MLSVLVANIVGPNGIAIEPHPRRKDGTIHLEFANAIRGLYRDWCKRPEVTWSHDWASAQRIAARSWIRDGEFLAQYITGTGPTINHGTRVPFSIELIESDFLPFTHNSYENPVIFAGVERNTWGKPIAYWVYKQHPGDIFRIPVQLSDLKRVPSDRMLHPKLVDRIGQDRGVSVFASVLGRLDDVKDYEESERIAAKVAACMAAYIKKGTPDTYDPTQDAEQRQLKFRSGLIFDDLRPGEDVGVIDTSRPNTQLEAFRNGQLRAVASGTGVTYSSLSKNYNGTYSSQRQELVEGWGAYQIICADFTSQFVRPVYEQFLEVAISSGQLVIPSDLDVDSLDSALFIGPQMPWIDPGKEAKAWEMLERNGHASGPEIVRRRGHNPQDVLEQERTWRQQWKEADMTNSADPANDRPAPTPIR